MILLRGASQGKNADTPQAIEGALITRIGLHYCICWFFLFIFFVGGGEGGGGKVAIV